MCTLTGQYATTNTRFSIVCTPNAVTNKQCPQLTNNGAGITLTVASSSFCAHVVDNVGVTLSMNSYSDSAFQNPNPTFVVQPNGNMFFLVSVQSSPKVSVTGLTVDQVVITSPHLANNGQLVLYDSINSNPATTPAGTTFQYDQASFTLPASGGPYAGFSIGEVPSWNVVQDTLDAATVQAQITVSYQGGGKKRFVHQSTLATQVGTNANVEVHGSNSSITIAHSFLLCLVFLFFLFL